MIVEIFRVKPLATFSLCILIEILKNVYSFSDVRASCKTIPNFTKQQLELCYKVNDVTLVAVEGLELSIAECQHQFRFNRWNCSSLKSKSKNPHSSHLFKKGYRESAFLSAISSAGVVLNVARACSQGRLLSCGCDPNLLLSTPLKSNIETEKVKFLGSIVNNPFIVDKSLEGNFRLDTNKILIKKNTKQQMSNRWKWAGCSHNIKFAIEFSKLFLESREEAGDLQSQINLHNSKVGRLIVSKNLVGKCKCHGLSGSCQLKTCWKASPDYRTVGRILKHQFRRAILVDTSNFGNGAITYNSGKNRNFKPINYRRSTLIQKNDVIPNRVFMKKRIKNTRMENSLFYFQKSPNFCEADVLSDIPGTHGRKCNQTSIGSDSCISLCCGRGYYLVKEITNQRCSCRFYWCCYVECQICQQIEWTSICN